MGQVLLKEIRFRQKPFELLRPIYRKTDCYGHFGRNEKEFSWELTDKAVVLRKQAARL